MTSKMQIVMMLLARKVLKQDGKGEITVIFISSEARLHHNACICLFTYSVRIQLQFSR